jgi:hypothetical protein
MSAADDNFGSMKFRSVCRDSSTFLIIFMGFQNSGVVKDLNPIFPVAAYEVLQSYLQNLLKVPEGRTDLLYSNRNADRQTS